MDWSHRDIANRYSHSLHRKSYNHHSNPNVWYHPDATGKQYVIRNDWMAYPFQTRTANQNPTYLGKTWTESNPNAEFPRLTTNANLARWNYQNNDFMMQNNRYIRLKTLIVGYTLPQIWTRKVKLEKVRVYFSGNDLWEATSIRDGFDPEMGAASNNSGYPFARTWSFGLNITL